MESLTELQATALLAAWPIEIESIQSLKEHRGDLIQATATTGEKFVLKNIGERDVVKGAEIQYRVTRHLHRNNIPVGYFLTTRDGGFYATDGTAVFVLMPHLLREAPGLFGSKRSCVFDNLGSAYARMHAALATFEGPVDTWNRAFFDRLFVTIAPRLERSLEGSDLAVVKDALDRLKAPMRELSPQLPEQVILGDCHTGNTLFWKGRVSGFVDCAHISLGPRIFDIASMASNMIVYDQSERRVGPWLESLPVYVSAYHRTNPLSPPERAAIPYGIESFALFLLDHFLTHGGGGFAEKTLGAVRWLAAHHGEVHCAVEAGFAGA